MAIFEANVTMRDAYTRETTKRYQVSAADIGAAETLWLAYLVDLAAFSGLDIIKWKLATEAAYTDAVTAGANLDTGATMSFEKADGDKVAVKVPAPVASVINTDGTIDVTDVIVTDWAANFTGGAILVSDGEQATTLLSGTLDK